MAADCSPAAPVETTPPPSGSVSETPVVFTPGTWLSGRGQYYFFDEDGASGRTAKLGDGTGVGFFYTMDGGQADFSMGSADNSFRCSVSADGDTIVLEWESGRVEHLSYVPEQGSDSFQFFSNGELAAMGGGFFVLSRGFCAVLCLSCGTSLVVHNDFLCRSCPAELSRTQHWLRSGAGPRPRLPAKRTHPPVFFIKKDPQITVSRMRTRCLA